MRVSKRAMAVSLAQTELGILLCEIQQDKDYTDAEMLARVTGLQKEILDMPTEEDRDYYGLRAEVHKHQKQNDLTDIEVLQALNSYMAGVMKYMLRYERHGNYDKPAMID